MLDREPGYRRQTDDEKAFSLRHSGKPRRGGDRRAETGVGGICWSSPEQEGPEDTGARPQLDPEPTHTAEASQTPGLGQSKPSRTEGRSLCKYIVCSSDTKYQITEAASLP